MGMVLEEEESTVGEHQATGRVERAIHSDQCMTRTLRDALESRKGDVVTPESPLIPWMVDHAGI